MNKKSSYGVFGVITVAVVLLIAIAVNLLFSLIPDRIRRIDLSTEQLTKVSDQAKEYLKKSLDSEVNVYLIAESGMEDISVREFLARLHDVDGRISYESLDPTVKRSFVERLTGGSADDIADNTVVVSGKKYGSVKIIAPENLYSYEAFVIDANAGEFVSYGEYPYREFVSVYASLTEYFESGYAYYDTKFNGETALISAIDYVLTDPASLPKVYFTSMHGESSVSDSLSEMLELSNLPAEPLTLKEGIPSDAGIVVMNVPITDISEKEAEDLTAYLSSGGKLFIITSHTHTESLKNLLTVLEKYGLSAQYNELYESNSSYYYPGYLNSLLPDPSTLEQLYGVEHYYFLASSAHAINKKSDLEGITYTDLLSTTTGAYYETDESGTQSDAAKFSIAVSAMSQDGGEVLWFACPYMLSEEDNDMTGGGNYVHFTSMLASLCNKNTAVFASKTLEGDTLTLSAAQAGFWAVILIAVIPGAFIVAGAVKVTRRRKA